MKRFVSYCLPFICKRICWVRPGKLRYAKQIRKVSIVSDLIVIQHHYMQALFEGRVHTAHVTESIKTLFSCLLLLLWIHLPKSHHPGKESLQQQYRLSRSTLMNVADSNRFLPAWLQNHESFSSMLTVHVAIHQAVAASIVSKERITLLRSGVRATRSPQSAMQVSNCQECR